jgi:predicted Zn-dependent peptidase
MYFTLMTFYLNAQVGSRQETEETQGVAHLLEHMMFKGTNSRPLQVGD